MRVEDITTRRVVTIGTDAEVRDVASNLIEKQISGMPGCNT